MQRLEYDAPANYRITILGHLSPDWSNRLNGMVIENQADAGHEAATILTGPLADQAALAGVLTTLYNLRVTLKSVERLAPPCPPADTQAA